MKFKEILKKIGQFGDSPIGAIIKSVVPGLGAVDAVLNAVNAATGQSYTAETYSSEVTQGVESLPESERSVLLEKEIDLEALKVNSYTEISLAQEMNNNSTRPQIAKDMTKTYIDLATNSFKLIVFSILADVVLAFGNVDIAGEQSITEIVMAGLAWIAIAYAVPIMNVIVQYFDRRSDDKRTAVASTGVVVPPSSSGILSKLAGLLNRN